MSELVKELEWAIAHAKDGNHLAVCKLRLFCVQQIMNDSPEGLAEFGKIILKRAAEVLGDCK